MGTDQILTINFISQSMKIYFEIFPVSGEDDRGRLWPFAPRPDEEEALEPDRVSRVGERRASEIPIKIEIKLENV